MAMRKLSKQPVGGRNDWDYTVEPGDRVFECAWDGSDYAYMYDLRESNGSNKASRGVLTPFIVKKNGNPRQAVLCDDNLWYWMD